MEAWNETIITAIFLAVLTFTCHKVSAECWYCPEVACVEQSDCPTGCSCVGGTGEIGTCMSTVGGIK